MYKIALKMLVEEKVKFIGMVLSLSFSTIIMIQQSAIFTGLMMRTYGTITDTPQADIWVMNRNVKYIDDITPLQDTNLFRVRSIDGVAWAVPFFKGSIRARLANGKFQTCTLIGIDGSTLIGAPHTMLEGKIESLRWPGAIIVNHQGAIDKLAQNQGPGLPKKPLQVGQHLELNDRRAVVVGICEVSRTFGSQPFIYTTYAQALRFSPFERKRLSFILVKSDGTIPIAELCLKIRQNTDLAAYSKEDFKKLTLNYYMKNTGIPINFGFTVLLGLLIGAAIAGLIFYNFVSDNLKYLALFSAMGASRILVAKMTILQALFVAFLGWGIGSGGSAIIGFLGRKTELSYHLSWTIFLGAGFAILMICIFALIISIKKVFNIELGTMFK